MLGVTYIFKQYLASVDGYIYTLTYTARDEVPSGSATYFERYEETVDGIATSLLFTGEGSAAEEQEEICGTAGGVKYPTTSKPNLFKKEQIFIDFHDFRVCLSTFRMLIDYGHRL